MIKFEKVKRFENEILRAPARSTIMSAGYDMYAAQEIMIPSMKYLHENLINHVVESKESVYDIPNSYTLEEMSELTKVTKCKPTLVPTGTKIIMPENCSCELYIRSSSPLKYWLTLANSVGLIDADYANNPDNDGEIFFQIINLSPFNIRIQKGECIGQAVIREYKKTDDDIAEGLRLSGFGSTDKRG